MKQSSTVVVDTNAACTLRCMWATCRLHYREACARRRGSPPGEKIRRGKLNGVVRRSSSRSSSNSPGHSTDSPSGDLSRLRIVGLARVARGCSGCRRLLRRGIGTYPRARAYVARAGLKSRSRGTQGIATAGGSTDLRSRRHGFVCAAQQLCRRQDCGRLARVRFEEGTRVRKGEVIAEIEHADTDAQLEASRRAVAEADAQLAQAIASRDEDSRSHDRQRALMKDGITTDAALTAAQAAAAVSAARVRSAEAAIASARARVRVTEEALENTNIRAPFDGVASRNARRSADGAPSAFRDGVARVLRDRHHRRPGRAQVQTRS